jgi:hypothetical protein
MSDNDESRDPSAEREKFHVVDLSLEQMHAEIESIRERLADEKPWYRKTSGVLSVCAFMLSIYSTVYGHSRDSFQEKQQARQTLNTVSQRLLALPKEGVEITEKYKDNIIASNYITPLLTVETDTLVSTMKDLMARYPSIATDSDKYVLAWSLKQVNRLPESEDLFRQLANTATYPNGAVAGYRELAVLQFSRGNPRKGKALYENAVSVLDLRFPDLNPLVKASYNQRTYILLANMQLVARNCNEAQSALDRAKEIPSPLNKHESKHIENAILTCYGTALPPPAASLLAPKPHPFPPPPISPSTN